MNWENYLLENKSPGAEFAHLGVIDGTVSQVFDLSTLPKKAKIISLTTPLKKFKLEYTNFDSLAGNINIEGIDLTDIDEERLRIFSTLKNLKYLQISFYKQDKIPDLSCLKSLEVLILANIKNVIDIKFIEKIENLKTLYIFGFNNLYDLEPLANLTSLQELSLHHGNIRNTGKPVKSMEPLGKLINLKYLSFVLNVENKNYDITPLLKLEKLQYLSLLEGYYKKGQKEILLKELPILKILK
jgi:hypothetical protein